MAKKKRAKTLRILSVEAAIIILEDMTTGKTYKIGRKQMHSMLKEEAKKSHDRVWGPDGAASR